MAHAQKTDFVFRRKGRIHLNLHGSQFSRLLAVEVRGSAVVMLDTSSSDVVWRVLATHSIRQFPLHLPFRASPCAITFQLDSTFVWQNVMWGDLDENGGMNLLFHGTGMCGPIVVMSGEEGQIYISEN